MVFVNFLQFSCNDDGSQPFRLPFASASKLHFVLADAQAIGLNMYTDSEWNATQQLFDMRSGLGESTVLNCDSCGGAATHVNSIRPQRIEDFD